MKKLSQHQETVLAAFDKKNADITISALYMKVYGHRRVAQDKDDPRDAAETRADIQRDQQET
jgi:hypothetical protein